MLSSPFCPSPRKICKEMINLAQLKENEIVYDLGAGDGRLLFEALKASDIRAVGVEISKERADYIINKAHQLGYSSRIKVVNDNFMNISLKNVDVLLLYLSPKDLALLRPKFELELKKGCRIISHNYRIPNWKPKEVLRINYEDRVHWLYLYQI